MLLSQLTTIFSGHPFRRAISVQRGTGFHAIRIGDISAENTINWSTVAETAPTSRRTPRWLKIGDILIALRKKPHAAILLDHIPKSAVASPHFMIIRVTRTDILLPDFLALVLNHGIIPAMAQTIPSRSNPAHLRVTDFANTPIATPPVEIQSQVVAIAKHLCLLRTAHTAFASTIASILQTIALEPKNQSEIFSLIDPLRQRLHDGYQALEQIGNDRSNEIREPIAHYDHRAVREKTIGTELLLYRFRRGTELSTRHDNTVRP